MIYLLNVIIPTYDILQFLYDLFFKYLFDFAYLPIQIDLQRFAGFILKVPLHQFIMTRYGDPYFYDIKGIQYMLIQFE